MTLPVLLVPGPALQLQSGKGKADARPLPGGFLLGKYLGVSFERPVSESGGRPGPLPAVQNFSLLNQLFAECCEQVSTEHGRGGVAPAVQPGSKSKDCAQVLWEADEPDLLPHPAHLRHARAWPGLLKYTLRAPPGEHCTRQWPTQPSRSIQTGTTQTPQRAPSPQPGDSVRHIPLSPAAGPAENGHFSGEAEPMNFTSDDSDMPQFPMPGAFGDSAPPNRLIPDVERDLMRSGGGYRPSRGILSAPPQPDPARDIKPVHGEVNPLTSQTFRASTSRVHPQREANLKEVVSRQGSDPIGPETLLEIRDLYRTGDRDRAFKLLEAFVRAYPHHEPATKLYRALTLQRKLSSEPDPHAPPASPSSLHGRETAAPRTSQVSAAPIVALGPAETTASDTPIPVLVGAEALGMHLSFQVEDEHPAERTPTPQVASAQSPAAPSPVQTDLPVPRSSSPLSSAPPTGSSSPFERIAQVPSFAAQTSPSFIEGATEIVRTVPPPARDPFLPDFTLEPALDAQTTAATQRNSLTVEEPSELPPEAFSNANSGLRSKYTQESIDWSWNGRRDSSTVHTASDITPTISQGEQPIDAAGAPSVPESWTAEPLTFTAEPFSSEPKSEAPLDWGYSQEPILNSPPPSMDPPLQIDEQITAEVAIQERDLIQFEERTEKIINDGPEIEDRQSLPLGTARNMLFGFFAPAPSSSLSIEPEEPEWQSSDSIQSRHPHGQDDPHLSPDLGAWQPPSSPVDALNTGTAHDSSGLSLYDSALPIELDTGPAHLHSDPISSHSMGAAQPILQEVLLAGVTRSVEEASQGGSNLQAFVLTSPLPNFAEEAALSHAERDAGTQEAPQEESLDIPSTDVYSWEEGAFSDAASGARAPHLHPESDPSWFSTNESSRGPAESQTEPEQRESIELQSARSAALTLDLNSDPYFRIDEDAADSPGEQSNVNGDPELNAEQLPPVIQISEDSIMELVVPKLMHTSILFTLEERLFLCALDGKRTVLQACNQGNRLPLTRALALLNELSQEGGAKVL